MAFIHPVTSHRPWHRGVPLIIGMGATLPASSLSDKPRFRCDADTLWSGDYRRLFADYCAGKGSKVRPLWCKGDYEKTPGLCALCGRICIVGRAGDPRTFDVPSRCESTTGTMPRSEFPHRG